MLTLLNYIGTHLHASHAARMSYMHHVHLQLDPRRRTIQMRTLTTGPL
jgi:hypothetical protein